MLHFIINPIAGHGRGKALVAQLRKVLDERGAAYQIHLSNYPGHAIALAREAAAPGGETVVAVGGDGTVSEVVTGIIGTNATLGIIPAGTGNDYCRCLHLPAKPLPALDVILASRTRRVDAVQLNHRTFINILNVGFDNEVAIRASRLKFLGKLSYLLAVFVTLPQYRGIQMRIVMDGRVIEQKAFMLVMGSGTHYGGGMMALPMADPADGLLDVCLIDDLPASRVIKLLPLFMQGKHERCPEAHFYRCKTLHVDGISASLAVGGDGEYMENATPADIAVLPGAISVIVA
jgi:YegS/Rv2252/BmrU family lipid kinase